MAQAGAELSEKSPSASTALGATDELLSQLAGSEIDRLLSESDAKSAAIDPGAPPEPLGLTTQLDDLFKELKADAGIESAADSGKTAPRGKAPAGESTPAVKPVAAGQAETPATNSAAAAAAPKGELTTQLDELFTELQKDSKAEIDEKAKAPARAAARSATEALPAGQERNEVLQAAGFDAAHPDFEGGQQFLDPDEEHPVDTERSAVLDAAGFEGGEFDAAATGETGRVASWLLMPLVLLNAPLAGASERTRKLVGWLGIVTFLNAAGALAWIVTHKH